MIATIQGEQAFISFQFPHCGPFDLPFDLFGLNEALDSMLTSAHIEGLTLRSRQTHYYRYMVWLYDYARPNIRILGWSFLRITIGYTVQLCDSN